MFNDPNFVLAQLLPITMFISGLVNLVDAMNTSVLKSCFSETGQRSDISITQ
jgi:hypothetical protein